MLWLHIDFTPQTKIDAVVRSPYFPNPEQQQEEEEEEEHSDDECAQTTRLFCFAWQQHWHTPLEHVCMVLFGQCDARHSVALRRALETHEQRRGVQHGNTVLEYSVADMVAVLRNTDMMDEYADEFERTFGASTLSFEFVSAYTACRFVSHCANVLSLDDLCTWFGIDSDNRRMAEAVQKNARLFERVRASLSDTPHPYVDPGRQTDRLLADLAAMQQRATRRINGDTQCALDKLGDDKHSLVTVSQLQQNMDRFADLVVDRIVEANRKQTPVRIDMLDVHQQYAADRLVAQRKLPRALYPPIMTKKSNRNSRIGTRKRRAAPLNGEKKRRLTAADKKAVAAMQQWMCNRCAKKLPARFEVDHIEEFAKTGNEHYTNLEAICGSCHLAKSEIDRKRENPKVWSGYRGEFRAPGYKLKRITEVPHTALKEEH